MLRLCVLTARRNTLQAILVAFVFAPLFTAKAEKDETASQHKLTHSAGGGGAGSIFQSNRQDLNLVFIESEMRKAQVQSMSVLIPLSDTTKRETLCDLLHNIMLADWCKVGVIRFLNKIPTYVACPLTDLDCHLQHSGGNFSGYE